MRSSSSVPENNYFFFYITVKIDVFYVVYYLKLFKQAIHFLSKLYDKSATAEAFIFFDVIGSCRI